MLFCTVIIAQNYNRFLIEQKKYSFLNTCRLNQQTQVLIFVNSTDHKILFFKMFLLKK